jgi:hypothetical protein
MRGIEKRSGSTETHRATLLLVIAAIVVPAPALARQPPPPDECLMEPVIEFAPWLSAGAGVRYREGDAASPALVDALGELALDFAFTFPLLDDPDAPGGQVMSSRLRFGPWTQVRTSSFMSLDLVGGLRLDIAGDFVGWFGAIGRWGFSLDGGVAYAWRDARAWPWDAEQLYAVGRLAWGFRVVYSETAGWAFDPSRWSSSRQYCRRPVRDAAGYARGFRVYVALRGAVAGSPLWEVTAGLEVELLGLGLWLSHPDPFYVEPRGTTSARLDERGCSAF